ncbi:MAG: hypothetical protein L0212_01140 [Acidobacteria bacterium]|nr:hypothetical protein [Acidobacteriota bacterium]
MEITIGAFTRRLAGLIVLSLLLSTAAWAQSAAVVDEKSTGNDAVAGQKVAIDPKTKKLRQPTQEESKALAEGMKQLLDQSTKELKVTQHPEGYVSIAVEGGFLNASVAKVNSDGTVSQTCVTTAEQAKDFLKSDATKKPVRKAAPQPVALEEK